MHQIISFWIKLRASLWFIPGIMLSSAIVIALILIDIDVRVDKKWFESYPLLFGLGEDGARGMLSSVASSMLTVAALVFGLTLNSMSQASSQFTPRIFRNFMRDRANQFALGYFVSVFVYCLIILRTIRGGETTQFVPTLAVLVGLLLALLGVIVLIFIIHHIANSLQITGILNNIVCDSKNAIKVMMLQDGKHIKKLDEAILITKIINKHNWIKVPNIQCGYIQNIDVDGLLAFSEKRKVIIQTSCQIGQFAGTGTLLLNICVTDLNQHVDFNLDQKDIECLNAFFSIASYRTIEHDVDFGIRQIVDIALKALSPGVNDTTTGVTCIDFISELLGEIVRHDSMSNIRTSENGGCVILNLSNFQSFVETAFDQIRISGKGNFAVIVHLLNAIKFIAECTDNSEHKIVLQNQLTLITDYAEKTLETKYEKDKLNIQIAKTRNFIYS